MIIVWLCWSGGEIEVQKVLTSQLYIVGGSLIGGKCPMHWPDQKRDMYRMEACDRGEILMMRGNLEIKMLSERVVIHFCDRKLSLAISQRCHFAVFSLDGV